MGLSTSATTLSRNGMSDWVIQRVTAILLALYTIGLVGYLVFAGDISYENWVALHSCLPMRIVNTLVVVSVVAHAWVGLWIVTTDYLTPMALGKAATGVRFVAQVIMILSLLSLALWGLTVIWRGY